MIFGQIIGAVGGLASSYLDGKVAVQKANAEIRVKQATGELDWDIAAMNSTQNSWKDEWITLLFSIPLILAFCGDWGNEIVQAGFTALTILHSLSPKAGPPAPRPGIAGSTELQA